MKCRNCKKKGFSLISKIGDQPISSIFLEKKRYIKNYSLNLFECNYCKLIQLSKIPGLQDMYGSTYGYKTSISGLMVKHLKNKENQLMISTNKQMRFNDFEHNELSEYTKHVDKSLNR